MKRIGRVIGALCFAAGALWLAACAPAGLGSTRSASQANYSAAPVQSPPPHLSAGSLTDSQLGQQLTDYFKAHRLPLVGAQAYTDASGSRQVVLYGFVATPFGKSDAADKTRSMLSGDPNIAIVNRIKIDPSLMSANAAAEPPAENSGSSAGATIPPPPSMGGVEAYQNQGYGYQGYGRQAYSYQQQQQQQQNPPDWMTMMLPLLMGGVGFGSSGGGISGYSFGGYGQPIPFGSPHATPYPGAYPAPYSPFFP